MGPLILLSRPLSSMITASTFLGPGEEVALDTATDDTRMIASALNARILTTFQAAYHGTLTGAYELLLDTGPLKITWGHPGVVFYGCPIFEQPDDGWTRVQVDLGLDDTTLSGIRIWRGGFANGIHRVRFETARGAQLTLRFVESGGLEEDEND